MPHRCSRLPPISLGPRPCGCLPGGVLCVCEAAHRRHPSLTVRTTSGASADRAPYVRGSAPSRGSRPPWPLGARAPSLDLTPEARPPPAPPGCWQPGPPAYRPPRAVAGPPGPPSHALRPVTAGNASSAMSYRGCWHIVGPRLSGPRRRLRRPRGAATPPGAGPLGRAGTQCLRFLTAADGGAASNPRWLAGREAQLGIVGSADCAQPNPPRAHPGAAAPTPRATGAPGQRLAAHAPLGCPPGRRAQLACVRRPARIRPEP